MHVPKLLGTPPAPWWGPANDLDLLIGICKHGYQQYPRMWVDPQLCFRKLYEERHSLNITSPHLAEGVEGATPTVEQNTESNANVGIDSQQIHEPAKSDEKSEERDSESSDSMLIDEQSVQMGSIDGTPAKKDEQRCSALRSEISMTGGDVDMEGDSISDAEDEAKEEIGVENAEKFEFEISSLETPDFHVPTPTELGVRIRRVIAGLSKYRLSLARGGQDDKQRLKDGKKAERLKLRENDLSRRQKLDFQRTLLHFGVPKKPGTQENDWTQFKVLADLERKSDTSLDTYLIKVSALANDTLAYYDREGKRINEDGSLVGMEVMGDTSNPDYPKVDGESISLDRAKKVQKRQQLFDKLRNKILPMEDVFQINKLEAKISKLVKHHAKNGLPAWWNPSLDYHFLKGCNIYGCSRGDLFFEDPGMPFKQFYQDYVHKMGFKNEYLAMTESAQTKGAAETKYWMKDVMSIKWMENLVTVLERGPRGPRKSKVEAGENSENLTPKSDLYLPDFLPLNQSRTSSYLGRAAAAESKQNENDSILGTGPLGSDSEDTDALIARADSRLKKRIKIRSPSYDLSYIPKLELFPNDEVLITAEIERLKQLYATPNSQTQAPSKRPYEVHYEGMNKKPKLIE